MTTVPEYRYFTADLITGSIVMEIPFSGVSWERKISAAGSFSGSIAVPGNLSGERSTGSEDHFDLYNTTLPGKHALYVMRNGICVWGGIIWSRDYSITEKRLNVSALEFVSYFHHRTFWKSFSTDTYQAINNSGAGSDSDTIKTFLETLINAVSTDQNGLEDDELSYGASDVHCRLLDYTCASSVATISTEEPHGFSTGDDVYVYGISGVGGTNGVKTNITVTGVRQFQYATSDPNVSTTNIGATVTSYAILESTRQLLSTAANVRITTDISTDLDGFYTEATGDDNIFTFRGSDGKYVGEIIRNFAEGGVASKPAAARADTDPTVSTRFDYFVESYFDGATSKFYNVFKAWLVRKDVNDPSKGLAGGVSLDTLYGPSVLGANNFIFEHPGNISSLTLNETADSASTRTWVIDNNNDMNNPAAKYYGSYTNLPYLQTNYPILETLVTDKNFSVTSDEQMAVHAKDLAYKLAPPIGEFTVSVNGSLQPTVGTYKPGDWCVVIPNDSFINNRLKVPYENRVGILVRKIKSMKVSVPDNPAFPETVDLELIPEWEDGI